MRDEPPGEQMAEVEAQTGAIMFGKRLRFPGAELCV